MSIVHTVHIPFHVFHDHHLGACDEPSDETAQQCNRRLGHFPTQLNQVLIQLVSSGQTQNQMKPRTWTRFG
jgi:hypothetical protein